FFSSRRRHTRFSRDWSSDVCSSDLLASFALPVAATLAMGVVGWLVQQQLADADPLLRLAVTIGAAALSYGAVIVVLGRHRIRTRSEERRVGKERTEVRSPYGNVRDK